jgi:hypothetical protein
MVGFRLGCQRTVYPPGRWFGCNSIYVSGVGLVPQPSPDQAGSGWGHRRFWGGQVHDVAVNPSLRMTILVTVWGEQATAKATAGPSTAVAKSEGIGTSKWLETDRS